MNRIAESGTHIIKAVNGGMALLHVKSMSWGSATRLEPAEYS
jgi:hypothetical protein